MIKNSKCPKCGCTNFKAVFIADLKMTLVCCADCEAVVAQRDDFLHAKIDAFIDFLKVPFQWNSHAWD